MVDTVITPKGINAYLGAAFDPLLIGNHNGYYANHRSFHIMGRCSDVDNALRSLWNGPTALYAPPTGDIQPTLVSTNAADAAAGIGIRTMRVEYLDSNFVTQYETVTLNGTTPVQMVAANVRRINAMHALTVGSAGAAVGNISLAAGGVTYSYVETGQNIARQAVFTVPDNHYAYLYRWDASSGSATGAHFTQTILIATCRDGVLVPGAFLPLDECGTLNNAIEYHYRCPLVLPPRCDIGLVAISDSAVANVIAMGTFSGWLEEIVA